MLWRALVAALLPLDLATMIERLPHIIARFAAMQMDGADVADHDRSRPRQVANFRSRFASRIRRAV